ncbi:hypothetical protein [Streptomyces canus]|nr:hypothetical protein [Streptomyces canus]WSD86582.1 hypothetical protein OG925_20750 [Streptomyces canus]
MEAETCGVLAYKGLGGVPTGVIVAIIVLVVLWVIVSVARRNRS